MALEPSEKYQCGTSLSVMSFVKNLKIGKTQNFQFRRAYCQYKNTPFLACECENHREIQHVFWVENF